MAATYGGLQLLTDLRALPDYDEHQHRGWGIVGGGAEGAPVDEEGNPIFYGEPDSWDARPK